MRGCESPLLSFLLIPSHLWKMSHQSTGGMWGGDDNFLTSCSSHYILGHSPNSWFELLPWTFYPPDYALAAGPLEASRAREMLSMRMNGTEANKPQEVGRYAFLTGQLLESSPYIN
ncbi:hypothetical protein T4A_11655 [Trichinella pseudospiralis]|uniref:Uncharacterized protein n=1 Tax=Trichinella pseudospiralis TaxID=6337 RepID=A0A0V1ER40_TRIPS|nr:hypothetical protein T4A_11655 [Trichinella pseudospiralis]